ncbi:exopolygalacturonase-like [Abrus precatorius]|uniref:Exopolygalacturonase-like n=1 Tax=Abrus precatorius TaxID=3816 RepID=A0A8B8K3I8_ABRPR|nr:exopolygalacturonase-like [Abrus precatorius]
MDTVKRIGVLMLCFALAYCVDAKVRVRPVAGPDIYRGHNAAKDVLAPGEKIVNVMSFGAKPDGKFDCTQAFMDGWRAACQSKVQARLLIPPGRFVVSSMFFSGPCLTPGPITIQVVGTVVATTDISEYENSEWLMFQNLAGLKLIGGGTFDGMGKSSWSNSENCEADPTDTCVRAPSSLYFSKVTNGIIQNIKSVDPKGFHVFVTNSANIRLRLLKLKAPATSPNTDGIHISNSINVKISKNSVETGDDCISMIQGVNNITINKLKCGPGHGISIGSLGKYENELEVKDIRVSNCTLVGTTNGLRIKSWPDKYPGAASGIHFSDITMENVKNPIIIDQEYECAPNCQKKPSLVKVRSVSFSNIRGTTISPIAVDLRCSKQFPCQNVQLNNINLKLGPAPTNSRCANIKPIYVGLQAPPACA